MKNNFILKMIALAVFFLAFLLIFTCCRERCCCPSVEVGLEAYSSGCCKDFQIWTWDPITNFPINPNKNLPLSSKLQPLRPYLFKTRVTNYSDVEVRGVTVVFYWTEFGLSDVGTPIGAVAVDLPERSSRWVSSPWSFILGEKKDSTKICPTVRVFHPCDTDSNNNYCLYNFYVIDTLKISWIYYAVPFVVDFRELSGNIKLKIESPDQRARALVFPRPLQEGPLPELPGINPIEEFPVEAGIPQDFSLVVENIGKDFKKGDTFDVNVRAIHEGQEISSFIVRYQVGEER